MIENFALTYIKFSESELCLESFQIGRRLIAPGWAGRKESSGPTGHRKYLQEINEACVILIAVQMSGNELSVWHEFPMLS